jgi:hypothetical protein
MTNRLVRLAVFASLALPAAAFAQADSGVPIPCAISYHFASRVLGESRVIDVALPVGYERDSAAHCPVLIVLDTPSAACSRSTPSPIGPSCSPAHRPTAREAAQFVGRWVSVVQADTHEVVVRVAGDTIVVHDRLQFPNGDWFEADDPVVQLTADGTLDWGLPFFRGLAALLVLRGKIQPDGTLLVTRESRGWVPRGPGGELRRTERFRKTAPRERCRRSAFGRRLEPLLLIADGRKRLIVARVHRSAP